MRVGILHEGDYDTNAITILVSRILKDHRITFDPFPAHGPILGKMKAAAFRFFEKEPVCDLAIFLADQDKDPSKQKKIRGWVQKYCARHPRKIIVGLPKPTLEQWLITDEDCLKDLFRCKGDEPLPLAEIPHPKTRLNKLALKYTDITSSVPEVYGDIAQKINLDRVRSIDLTFKRFHNDLQQSQNS